MEQGSQLRDHFLIAMPSLREGIFAQSVTYLCDHSESGALGLVINHPLDLSIGDVLDHLELPHSGSHPEPVFAGGPVHTDRGFVLHRRSERQWDSSLPVNRELCLTTSLDILHAIADGSAPQPLLVALGYAGWGPGQLEEEIAANAWLTLPADPHILFELPPEQRLQAAAARLGVDLNLMAPGAGHA